MITFIRLYWKQIAVAVALVGAFAYGFHCRGIVEAAKHAKELETAIVAMKQAEQRAHDAEDRLAQAKAKTETVTRYINRKVVEYVQVNSERISLPPAFRVLHDAAATNATPPERVNAAAGEVDDAATLSTITTNYAECNRWRDALIGWQDWYLSITK